MIVTGTGRDDDRVYEMGSDALVGSYDPAYVYDRNNLNHDGNVGVNGSASLDATAGILGHLTVTGSLRGSSLQISGTLEENAEPIIIEDIDPIVLDAYDFSRSVNDNARLSSIFGSLWSPVSSSENYGDLIVDDGGSYVIPAGTYRFRRLEIRNDSTVTFDTSGGSSKLVYVGSGKGTGKKNDLQVADSNLLIDPGETTNGLLTVLGTDSDFLASGTSVYGQAVNDPRNAGYSQIISLGGNTSSDFIGVSGTSQVFGRLYAAAHEVELGRGCTWFGSVLVRKVLMDDDTTIAVDTGVTGTTLIDTSSYEVVATWPVR